ncbi:MAG: hypothetical protein KGZ83_12010 [Sulfuricella sp.]|nr:hypothetical protein [Sulfuricella sp.]
MGDGKGIPITSCPSPVTPHPSPQRGVVLFITLIVLVAMTLAGIALVRSVATTTLIAGNLSFQEGATMSGDTGIESAVNWLEINSTGTNLFQNNLPMGYVAAKQDPAVGQTWDAFWANQLVPAGQVLTLAKDAAGNTVSYVIQRMCSPTIPQPFAPTSVGANCASSPTTVGTSGGSKGAGAIQIQTSDQTYYRITSRIVGPRNTVSFIQAIVAM